MTTAAVAGRGERTQVLRAELLTLVEKHGRISPRMVLDVARKEDHPLHSFFEWNDEDAAEGFRLIQAAGLIRQVRLKITRDADDPRQVGITIQRGIVSVPSLRGSEAGSYMLLDKVPDIDELKQEALTQLEGIKKKYEHLVELESVWSAIDAAKASGVRSG